MPLLTKICWPKEHKIWSPAAVFWESVHVGLPMMVLGQAAPLIPSAAPGLSAMCKVQNSVQEPGPCWKTSGCGLEITRAAHRLQTQVNMAAEQLSGMSVSQPRPWVVWAFSMFV